LGASWDAPRWHSGTPRDFFHTGFPSALGAPCPLPRLLTLFGKYNGGRSWQCSAYRPWASCISPIGCKSCKGELPASWGCKRVFLHHSTSRCEWPLNHGDGRSMLVWKGWWRLCWLVWGQGLILPWMAQEPPTPSVINTWRPGSQNREHHGRSSKAGDTRWFPIDRKGYRYTVSSVKARSRYGEFNIRTVTVEDCIDRHSDQRKTAVMQLLFSILGF
jgi:hypothetical protein